MKKLTAECDYTMPVLSEQEKLVLIDNAMVFLTRVKCGNLEASKFDVYQAQIALAALTAKPVGYVSNFSMELAADGRLGHISNHMVAGLEGSYVYTTPPVPVKQEGEQ